MAQQKITVEAGGADSRRVLDALTPVNNTTAPAVNAKFLGQIYVNETADTAYIAIAVGSATPANDWKQITFVA